mmetsp:Transcript_11779/g.10419  ORF Transcript_11779/g.10419 Transcript_11779/m.10419 type:complete len:163 (+) Transcript_11779:190-678(+)
MKNFLVNKDLEKSNTDDHSSELSYNKKEKVSILQPQWSGAKQHASTSRISTCLRLEKDRIEGEASTRSNHLYSNYAAQDRRSIHKSMNYRETDIYSSRNQENTISNNLTTFREVIPESRYRIEYDNRGRRDRAVNPPNNSNGRNLYKSSEGYSRQFSSRNMY